MKIYISGKMTGLTPRQIKKNFNKLEENLILHFGHCVSVMNPAVTYNMKSYKEFSYEDWLKIDFAMIDVCDSVYLLKNWEDSEGAKKEIAYAFRTNKKIFFPTCYGYVENPLLAQSIAIEVEKAELKNRLDEEKEALLEEVAVKILKEKMNGQI